MKNISLHKITLLLLATILSSWAHDMTNHQVCSVDGYIVAHCEQADGKRVLPNGNEEPTTTCDVNCCESGIFYDDGTYENAIKGASTPGVFATRIRNPNYPVGTLEIGSVCVALTGNYYEPAIPSVNFDILFYQYDTITGQPGALLAGPIAVTNVLNVPPFEESKMKSHVLATTVTTSDEFIFVAATTSPTSAHLIGYDNNNADDVNAVPNPGFANLGFGWIDMNTLAFLSPLGAFKAFGIRVTPVSTNTGDPHFVGFHGQMWDFSGDDSKVFNLLTDKNIQVNSMFHRQCDKKEAIFINETGIKYKDFKIRVTSRSGYEVGREAPEFFPAEVNVNGIKITEPGAKFYLEGNEYLATSQGRVELNLDDYIIRFKFDTSAICGGSDIYHIDHQFIVKVDQLDPHGLVGHTLHTEAGEMKKRRKINYKIEGEDSDYEVAGANLFGDNFTFNKYKGSSPSKKTVHRSTRVQRM